MKVESENEHLFSFLLRQVRIYLGRYDKYGPKLGDTKGGTGKVRYATEPICCAPQKKKKKKKKKRLRTSSGTWFLDIFYLASTHSS